MPAKFIKLPRYVAPKVRKPRKVAAIRQDPEERPAVIAHTEAMKPQAKGKV